MKAIISLSLAAISFQGIVLGNSKIPEYGTNSGLVNQLYIREPFKIAEDNHYEELRKPTFINKVPLVSQAPLISQVPLVNQVPLIKHDPYVKHPYYNYNAQMPIGVVNPTPIYTTSTPFYSQPIVQPTMISQTPVIDAAAIEEINRNQCRIDGRFSQLCVRKNIFLPQDRSTYQKKYECLKNALCTFRDNKCQWLQTKKYRRCIKKMNIFERLYQQKRENLYVPTAIYLQ